MLPRPTFAVPSTSTMLMTGRDHVSVEAPDRSSLALGTKRLVQGCFGIGMLPRILLYQIARRIVGRNAFLSSSEAIAKTSGYFGVYCRQAFYTSTLAHCGKDVWFGWMSILSMSEAKIGDRVYVGHFCSIGFADIEADVMLADHVTILSGGREHSTDATNSVQGDPAQSDVPENVIAGRPTSLHDSRQNYQRVRIGRGAWIGAGAVIMADVGPDTIIGAGAVVTRPIPAGVVAAGVPARVLHPRTSS